MIAYCMVRQTLRVLLFNVASPRKSLIFYSVITAEVQITEAIRLADEHFDLGPWL